MCTYDRKTDQKLRDCGDCGCMNSVNDGKHGNAETVTLPNGLTGLKCMKCGLYL